MKNMVMSPGSRAMQCLARLVHVLSCRLFYESIRRYSGCCSVPVFLVLLHMGIQMPGASPPVNIEKLSNQLGMEFVKIPACSFVMGSHPSDSERSNDEMQHQVILTKTFYMQTTEVTQAQWVAVMQSNPSRHKGDNLPVEKVSWNDVQDFIRKLNAEGQGIYRLPTEAEWEVACRAGTQTRFYTGNCLSSLQANYDAANPIFGCSPGESSKKTIAVGSFSPNAWGLYDMHGNVWEWCEDWYDDRAKGDQTDPQGPPSGSDRVKRGGSWQSIARSCRSTNRYYSHPDKRSSSHGFRLVRTSDTDSDMP